MARISKDQSEKYTQELIDVINKIGNDRDLLGAFIKDLLTPTEYKDFGVRWQIIKRLVGRQKHRDISEDLKVGIATVTRGSRELADPKGGFWRVTKKLKS